MKTSGSKGFHVVVPLGGTADFDEVAAFAHRAGALLVKRHPERLTQGFLKADGGDRVFVDTGRNGWSATFAATYTVRARPGAPVSAPCSWSEVERGELGPRSFILRSIAERLDAVGDRWAELTTSGHLVREATERLKGLHGLEKPVQPSGPNLRGPFPEGVHVHPAGGSFHRPSTFLSTDSHLGRAP